jgi:glutamate 5-kinase
MLELIQQIARLHQAGREIILVSSGAVAAGRERVSHREFSRSVPARQMLSAIGQSHLMRIYTDLFDIFSIVVAQVLLTRDDLSHRTRYLNARDTLQTLLEQRILPIINENDTVATEEIRVGDNDNLSALVASALESDLLVILTDQGGLYTADPRSQPDAQLIEQVTQIDDKLLALAGGAGTRGGTGGMVTKLQAARTATLSGVTTVIAAATAPEVLARLAAGEAVGTRFAPVGTPLESRKRWLLTDRPQGAVQVDAGARRAMLARDGASLLPVGIVAVQGDFARGATISVLDPDGAELAHGLTSYDSDALRLLCRKQSHQIIELLGYSYGDAAIHRNNLVLLLPA